MVRRSVGVGEDRLGMREGGHDGECWCDGQGACNGNGNGKIKGGGAAEVAIGGLVPWGGKEVEVETYRVLRRVDVRI